VTNSGNALIWVIALALASWKANAEHALLGAGNNVPEQAGECLGWISHHL
jgi:vacuolar-type H+-ATPase subunit I/STV1